MNMNAGMGSAPMMPAPEEKRSTGALIGIVIIVLILIAGALYAFMNSKNSPPEPATMNQDQAMMVKPSLESTTDATISALSSQGGSTDLTDIQKDLNTTDLSGLDAGLEDATLSL